jgi:hypothetical protein
LALFTVKLRSKYRYFFRVKTKKRLIFRQHFEK